jgi:hypothetical protein
MIHGIQVELAQAAEMVLNSELALTAKLHWRTVTRPVGWDVNDESSQHDGVVEPGEMEFRALFHQVDQRLSGFQRFMEVETGDVILDYLADLELDGKDDLRVEINGRLFVQKNASAALKEAWDAYADHGGSMKTLLLTPAG